MVSIFWIVFFFFVLTGNFFSLFFVVSLLPTLCLENVLNLNASVFFFKKKILFCISLRPFVSWYSRAGVRG